MPYWRLFYHIAWATKDRQALIKDGLATPLHEQITKNAERFGAIVHAIGGVEDHVHLAVSVPPSIALSELVGQLKGSSSHFVNHELAPSIPFAWQSDYGVISLDSKQLDKVTQYVTEQKEHHTRRTTIAVLERLSQEMGLEKTQRTSKTNP